jgi:dTMP kinase
MFITFEGIEGCGKSTQAKKLERFFKDQGKKVILTREPGGTVFGERIREILVDEKTEKLEAKTELFLNFAARLEHVNKLIKPALKDGNIVISDRFFDSTYAYQGSAFGLEKEIIDEVRKMTIGDFCPDLTFFIDLPVYQAFKRIDGRKENNRYEKMGFDFHEKVRDGFLKLSSENERIIKIDGNQLEEKIFEEIKNKLSLTTL